MEDNRPSVIAAAAALLALDDRLTRRSLELKMNSISHCRFLEIVSCFSRIHFFFSYIDSLSKERTSLFVTG